MPSEPKLKQLALYTFQGQQKEFAFGCLPFCCHKLLANINRAAVSSLSRLLRKPLENQKGSIMMPASER